MKRYTILIAAVAAIGGLLFGFDTAVIAGTLPALRQYFTLDDSAIGLLVAAASIGCIPGALFSGNLANRYGRKLMMLVTAVFYVVAAVGSGIAASYEQLVVYRFIGGLAIGMASTLAPIYISEVAPAQYRGRLGMSQQLAIVLGILLAFISNYVIDQSGWAFLTPDNSWRYMLAAAVIPSVIFFFLLLLVPESPRWLIQRDRQERAQKVFGKIYDPAQATAELESVRRDITAGSKGLRFAAIFSAKYRKVVWIGVCFAAIAQLTGINIIFYYAPLIFERTNVGGSVLFQTVLTGVVNLIFTIVAFWLIDRLGRKLLLLIGSAVMGVCMVVVGALFYTDHLDNYWVLAAVFVYIAAFACTWGAVLWVYVAEIFSNKIRGSATSFAIFGNWTANAIVSWTFPVMLAQMGAPLTFFIYGVINFLMIAFVAKYVFETKGVALEQVEQMYERL